MPINGIVLAVGSGSGIGRATALAAVSQGASVLISADLNLESAQETARLAKDRADAEGRKIESSALQVDVRDESSVIKLISDVVASYKRIDVFFTTAGVGGAGGTPIADMTLADYRSLDEVNNIGSFLCVREVLKQMRTQELRDVTGATSAIPSSRAMCRGSIVILASLASEGAFIGVGNYTASKHAVKGLVQTAAIENGRKGIRINAVAPSYVTGPMMEKLLAEVPAIRDQMLGDLPMGRLATADEIADCVLFLASGAASYINGHTLVVDGGASLQLSNTPFKD